MSTHNIWFYGEISKIIPKLSENSLPICSTELRAQQINMRFQFAVLLELVNHLAGPSLPRNSVSQVQIQGEGVGAAAPPPWSRFLTYFNEIHCNIFQPCHLPRAPPAKWPVSSLTDRFKMRLIVFTGL